MGIKKFKKLINILFSWEDEQLFSWEDENKNGEKIFIAMFFLCLQMDLSIP